MGKLLILVSALLAALPAAAYAQLSVVTTTTDLADFVRTIGKDSVQVRALCSGAQDPHHMRAKPSYMVSLRRADLLVSVGMELESAWLPLLVRGARNPNLNPGRPGHFVAGHAISPIDVPTDVSRSGGDLHPSGNPHFWLDPLRAKQVVSALAERMAQLDGGNAAAYRANAAAWGKRIDGLTSKWQQRLAPHANKPVVSYHATFNYFFRRFSLRSIGNVEDRPGIPPSPSQLTSLTKRMAREQVQIVLHEIYYARSASQLIASRSRAKLLVLPTSVGGIPAAGTYEALIDHLVEEVASALSGR